MVEIKIKIPKELEEIKEDWERVALEAIKLRAFEIELEKSRKLRYLLFKALISKSKIKEKNAIELGKKINEKMFSELREKDRFKWDM